MDNELDLDKMEREAVESQSPLLETCEDIVAEASGILEVDCEPEDGAAKS